MDKPVIPVSVGWAAYLETLNKVALSRGRVLSSFDEQVALAVFDACSQALQDFHQGGELWRVIAAPTGSGKTTAAFTKCFG